MRSAPLVAVGIALAASRAVAQNPTRPGVTVWPANRRRCRPCRPSRTARRSRWTVREPRDGCGRWEARTVTAMVDGPLGEPGRSCSSTASTASRRRRAFPTARAGCSRCTCARSNRASRPRTSSTRSSPPSWIKPRTGSSRHQARRRQRRQPRGVRLAYSWTASAKRFKHAEGQLAAAVAAGGRCVEPRRRRAVAATGTWRKRASPTRRCRWRTFPCSSRSRRRSTCT